MCQSQNTRQENAADMYPTLSLPVNGGYHGLFMYCLTKCSKKKTQVSSLPLLLVVLLFF